MHKKKIPFDTDTPVFFSRFQSSSRAPALTPPARASAPPPSRPWCSASTPCQGACRLACQNTGRGLSWRSRCHTRWRRTVRQGCSFRTPSGLQTLSPPFPLVRSRRDCDLLILGRESPCRLFGSHPRRNFEAKHNVPNRVFVTYKAWGKPRMMAHPGRIARSTMDRTTSEEQGASRRVVAKADS